MIRSVRVRHGDDDLAVVNAARTSFAKHKETFDNKDARLIHYLVPRNHWTPLGHVTFLARRRMRLHDYVRYASEPSAGRRIVLDHVGDRKVEFLEAASLWFHLSHPLWMARPIYDAIAERCPVSLEASGIPPVRETREPWTEVCPHHDAEHVLEWLPEHLTSRERARLVTLTFRVEAPVAIAAQLFKHQVSLEGREYVDLPHEFFDDGEPIANSISRRYVDSEPEFFTPDVWRARAEDKKQGSRDEPVEDSEHLSNLYDVHVRYSRKLYREFVEPCRHGGVAPEMARMLLPQSMMTSWWWTGSAEAFRRVVDLRTKPDAQKETREAAQGIAETLSDLGL